jgi:dolichol-phosphate mannosyltransferase
MYPRGMVRTGEANLVQSNLQEQRLPVDVVADVGPVVAPVFTESVAVVVPTYREVEALPHLIARLAVLRLEQGLDLTLYVMDDDSRDGTVELIDKLALPWVKLVVRTADRGLSQAVLAGLRLAADADVLVCMDADLSHPPEKIVDMLMALRDGADFVVGSRFCDGGSTDDDWGFCRWLNSRVATMMARPLTTIADPMSGFFALRRSTFAGGAQFNPVGYKIGLELLIKCRCRKVVEVPIHFTDRRHGESKLSITEQLKYLQHVRRLYIFRFGTWSHLFQFCMVGFSGMVLNLALLTGFLWMRMNPKGAVALAIGLSMVWNFLLNRRFSFSYARSQSMLRQLAGFVGACSIGAMVNYAVTMWAMPVVRYAQLAAAIGIVAGTGFNFVASRFWVFKKKHVAARGESSKSKN